MSVDGAPLGDERILIVGGGSLGSVFGAFLAHAGGRVQMLAREPHARAIMQRRGIVVHSPQGEWLSPPLLVDWRPDRLGPADVAIVLTKAPDTAAALSSVAHALLDVKAAVSLQNGVQKDTVLADAVGEHAVVGGSTMVGGALLGPGVVRHSFAGVTFVGELDGRSSCRVDRLAALLGQVGLQTIATERIRSVEWSKLAIAAPAQAVSVLTRRYYHEVLSDPQLAQVVRWLVQETAAVARAQGVELEDWPGLFPAGSVARASGDDADTIVRSVGRALVEAGDVEVKPSMLQSLEQGGVMEIEALQGFIVGEANRLSVAVPAMELCHRLLVGLERTRGDAPAAVETEDFFAGRN
jgi:2-dehydropantoate 2-reductase